MCKIKTFQWNRTTIFLQLLKIYLFTKIFQKVKVSMLRWNILQYLRKMSRQYFSCNERLEIFWTCFWNILCYMGRLKRKIKRIQVNRETQQTNKWRDSLTITFKNESLRTYHTLLDFALSQRTSTIILVIASTVRIYRLACTALLIY